MTRNPKPTNPRRKKVVLPALSDEALIQIQDFLGAEPLQQHQSYDGQVT